MGTRSITYFYDEHDTEDKPFFAFYRQFDGYIDGHGKELLEMVTTRKLINGYNLDQEADHENGVQLYANGAGDLAAQILSEFKQQKYHNIGGIYICNPNEDGSFVDYTYHVHCNHDDDFAHVIGIGYGQQVVLDSALEDPYIGFKEEDDE